MKSDYVGTLPPDMAAGKKEKPAEMGTSAAGSELFPAAFRYLRLAADFVLF
jgi:hypothetical protein